MTGEQVLREFAERIEAINPGDRFCPLCRALLGIIKLGLERLEVRDEPPETG